MIAKIIRSCVTRRSLVRGLAVFPLVGMAATTARAAKFSQKSVAYQDAPRSGEDCSNCSCFQSPMGCALVEWPVNPSGWCHIWTPKA